MKTRFLYPGQLAVAAEPCKLTTILGSCVGVALFDDRRRIGGLCHYLLPDPGGDAEAISPRYGAFAIPELLNQVVSLGADRSSVSAKVYGGGNVVSALMGGPKKNIGQKNIDCAKTLLETLGIPILEIKVGGNCGCRIEFDTSTFQVDHRPIDNGDVQTSGFKNHAVAQSVKVLIVDDSATARHIFTKAIDGQRGITVVGAANDPYEAREKIVQLRPDVLILDIEMPRMNGIAFLERLMAHHPMPVIMVSSLGAEGTAAQRALELGAVEFVNKPSQFDPSVLRILGDGLVPRILAAASVPISELKKRHAAARSGGLRQDAKTHGAGLLLGIEAVCIGGNAGAPDSLADILRGLPSDTPPVFVALSTIASFAAEFARKLQPHCRVKLDVSEQGQLCFPGHVYLAPSNVHLTVGGNRGSLAIELSSSDPVSAQRPSADLLFTSASEKIRDKLCAVLLSGFGDDGVAGLIRIRELGGTTIVESPDAAAFGFAPTAAIESGAADHVISSKEIAAAMQTIRNKGAANG